MQRLRVLRPVLIVIALVSFGIAMMHGCKDGKVNLFTLEQDKEFGMQLSREIASKPDEYPVLQRAEAPQVYTFIEGLRDEILRSGELKHASDFSWDVKIIHGETMNAFCAPGGYIYFYTGLLKYLDSEAEVAGVLGHEMAHADQRHSTTQMTKKYGVNMLLSILVGDNASTLTMIAAQLAKGATELAFSRKDESEADDCAVRYLSKTKYNSLGVAGFFQKLVARKDGGASPPEFLSTHPSHEHRIRDIQEANKKYETDPNKSFFKEEYTSFKEKYLKKY